MTKNKFDKKSFLDWIAFQSTFDLTKSEFVGHCFGATIILIGLAVFCAGGLTIVQYVYAVIQFNGDHEAIRNIGLVAAAVLGAPFVIWRAMVAQKQANTSEQSHITDQINKAVAGLGAERKVDRIGRPISIVTNQEGIEAETIIEWQGSPICSDDYEQVTKRETWQAFSETRPSIEVRVGAIYSLERLAQDSPRDHVQVMEILAAYIRENSPIDEFKKPSNNLLKRPRPRTDIQTAIDVIGRRSDEQIAIERDVKYRVDLRHSKLSGANFTRGNFEGAIFYNCCLEGAIIRRANFRAARMQMSHLNYADFFQSDLTGAILDGANISALEAMNGSFTLANRTLGMSLAGADISAVNHLRTEGTHSPTFGTKDTKLHHSIAEKYQERLADIDQFSYLINGLEIDDADGVKQRLMNDGLLYWSPFESRDLTTGQFQKQLWDDLGMNGFPFED